LEILKSQSLVTLFDYFNKNSIDYCVVGDAELLPEIINGDVDIVISESDFSIVVSALTKFCNDSDCRLVQVLKHEVTAFYYVLSFLDENKEVAYLHPDICSDYCREGRLLISSDRFLKNKRIAKSRSGDEKPFYAPPPEVDFIYYLIKKIEKGSVDQVQLAHLRYRYFESPFECEEYAKEYFTDIEISSFLKYIKDNKLDGINNVLPKLKRKLLMSRRSTVWGKCKNVFRKTKRIFQPTGLIIAFLGPDGAGKTAIGECLEKDLAPAFRGVRRFHLKPRVLLKDRNQSGVSVDDPHSQPSRGVVASLLKLGYFLADYLWGFISLIQQLKIRSHLIIFDRYFHDLLVDPVRYRYGAPMWVAKLVSVFIPKPDLFIILDAPANVIQARKQEVSLEETERQRKAYLEFAASQDNCIVLDTSIGIEETALLGSTKVLEFMEERLASRLM